MAYKLGEVGQGGGKLGMRLKMLQKFQCFPI